MHQFLRYTVSVFLVILLSACTSMIGTSNSKSTSSPVAIPSAKNKSLSTTDKANLFADQLEKANFGIKILNDDKLINEMLAEAEIENGEFTQCVKSNIEVYEFTKLLKVGGVELAELNVSNLDLWLSKMDFLVRATNAIYFEPKEVEFDVDNLSGSSAFTLFNSRDADELKKLILDKRFSPVMRAIGLPMVASDGTIVDTINKQTTGSILFITRALNKCASVLQKEDVDSSERIN